jgi:hypothetical protein
MDKNKFSTIICDAAKACATELISILKEHNVTTLEFKDDEDGVSYLPTVCFYNDNDCQGIICDLTHVELVTNEGKPYIKIWGNDNCGGKFGAYINEDGGEFYDVEHSIGEIYRVVVERLGLAD